jgi:hypothetical protein
MRRRTWIKYKALVVGFLITFGLMLLCMIAVYFYTQLPMKSVQKIEPYKKSEVFIVYLEDTTGTSEFDDTVVKRYVDNMGIVHETRKNPYGKETW